MERLGPFKELIGMIPTHKLMLVRCLDGRSLMGRAVPAVVLGRFFGKGVILQLRTPEFEELLTRHRRWLMPALRLADRIVVGSRYLERILDRAHLPVNRLADPVTADASAYRPVGKLQPKVLVDVALEPHHQVGLAVKAFRLVKQKYPRAELVITGSGTHLGRLERMVDDLNLAGVTFGVDLTAEELQAARSECDIYVNPSAQEESPSGMIEAMASGLPVVCTDADGLLHLVRDGVSGLIVPMGDYVGLADSIIELIENNELTERLSREGLAEAKKHTWARVRQDWVNLFHQIVGTRRN